MNQRRVIIVHGWEGRPGQHWTPWLKKELEAQHFAISEPAMPDTERPVIERWVEHLAKVTGELNENTYFIGHSIGCQAILRYLETQTGKAAGGCVFVAGWFKLDNLENDEAKEIAEPWLTKTIDFSKVLSVTKNFAVINSSNDDYGCVEENKKLFEENLGAKVIILENKGHFTADDGVTELPEALAALEGIVGKRSN